MSAHSNNQEFYEELMKLPKRALVKWLCSRSLWERDVSVIVRDVLHEELNIKIHERSEKIRILLDSADTPEIKGDIVKWMAVMEKIDRLQKQQTKALEDLGALSGRYQQ